VRENTTPTSLYGADSTAAARRARVNARLDRLPSWGLRPVVYLVLGLCYLLAFYDIAVIGVALPRIVADLHLSGAQEALPITTNLVGYIVGAYLLGNVADALGRRRTLGLVVLVLAVAAVLTALSWDAVSLAAFRFLAGIGIGAQITLSATLIGEFAPASRRGRYLSLNIVWAAVGNIVPALLALPLLSGDVDTGWRVLFGLPGVIVFILLLFRDHILPESPRWLAAHGELDRAESIVSGMEDRARRDVGAELAPVVELPPEQETHGFPTAALFRGPFVGRLVVVLGFWFAFYFSIYAFLAYGTTLLGKLGVPLPNPVLATALGFVGGVAGACVQPLFIDRVERKYSVIGGLVVFALGFVVLALASGPVTVTVGSFLTSMGIFLAIIPAYAYTAEVFPTRARASAMGVADGLGHAGGAVQPFVVVPLLAAAGSRSVFWLLAAISLAALLVMLGALRTSRRPLTELAR
jgi:putative MFS transporter